MSIYVTRHGQTDWNVNGLYQGQEDIPLNSTGIKQAYQLKNKLKNISFDLVISSPLIRSLDTAKICISDRNIPLLIDDNLIERSFGDLEGLKNSPNLDCPNDILLDYNLNFSKYNVEPIKELFKRVYSFLDELKIKYANKNILLVTHNGISIAIDCYFNGIPNNTKLIDLSLDNCKYRKYNI